MRVVAQFVESVGADALIDVGEVWLLPESQAADLEDLDGVWRAPGRQEALQVTVATREGLLQTHLTEFTRGPLGGIKFGDTHQLEKNRTLYLQPVFEVWRRQGYAHAPDGTRIPRIWEPDPLDTCFCGGPKRFAECCSRLLDGSSKKRGIDELLDAALKAGDFARAEEFARAALAQYVIWVRHTTITMNVAPDLYRQMVEIDARALEVHIARLREPLVANGHSASFLPQLRHLSVMIGVPELSVRITARAAQWLFESGDYAGAAGELKSLGDIDQLNDTLALMLACELLDLPDGKQTDILTRAVAGAFTEEEKWLAQLKLARHLLECDQRPDALLNMDSVVNECRDKTYVRELLGSALVLRAQITQEKDFAAARKEMEVFAEPEHEQRFAIMLIEHGDFDEAERVLSEALKAGEPVAQLLVIDARLRSGRIDAARELLLSVDRERITARLRYPYAVTCALVAVACEDQKLKDLATAYLHELPSAGSRIASEVNKLLKALNDREQADPEGIMTRLRHVFTGRT